MDIRKSEKIFSYLDKVQQKHAELSRQLSGLEPGRNQRQFVELAKELNQLKPLVEKFRHLSRLRQRIGETEELLQNPDDGEMCQLAEEDLQALHAEKQDLEKEVFRLMVTDTTLASRNVFLEIRAGTGGDEASLFATDLLRLYLRIAEKKKWQSEIISSANSGVGGLKEVIIYLKGKDVYNFLQFESGVHRVQRVPVTEASGRIHTSTVTVAILPEIDEVSVEINPKDIRIDTYAASGHGGQHVNKTESAIRITHFPSGIVVTCQDEKSQHKNKDKAMKVLRARLYEFEKEKRNEDIARNRKQQVGSGERSEKIRTYNFPQNRVTDHRLNGRNFPIDFIMAGDIDDLIAELEKQHSDALIEKKIAAVCQ